MLTEINHCANQLHLPIPLPVTRTGLKFSFLGPPEKIGYQGRLDTEHYSFCFGPSGKLRFIINLNDDRGDLSVSDYLSRISKVVSTINTNDAYLIASNWLAAIDVNIEKLEKAYPPVVRQQSTFETSGTNRINVNLPLFDVKWGKWEEPTIQVCINGADGSLLKLRQEDDSYSNRPTNLIANLDKLLKISDQEFKNYSEAEQQKLLERFVGANGKVTRKP